MKLLKTFLIIAIFSNSMFSVAQHDTHSEGHVEESGDTSNQHAEPKSKKQEITGFIDHHLQDSYDFIFFSDKEAGKHYGFPLPVIIWDEGLKVFSSSKFHHGESVAEVDGANYALHHSKIYRLKEGATAVALDKDHHPKNAKKILLDFSITKNVITMLFVAFLMFLMFTRLAKSYKKGPIPTGFGRVLEPLILYVRDEIALPNIGEKKYRKFFGYLLTVFFFIWILNLLGMTPLGVNVTGNISVTVALTLFTYVITTVCANKDYWMHIFWMPGVPVIMKIILIPIELLGTLTKPFALLIRLFANITAGHVVIMSLISLIFIGKNFVADTSISLVLTLFISVIELLVAFLQAFIFTMLSSLFIGMAVQEHDHH